MAGAELAGVGVELIPSPGTGTVTTVSVATANGFSGSVANPTTTPAITLSVAGASDTQVLFKDGAAVAGNAGLTFNKTTGVTLAQLGGLKPVHFADLPGSPVAGTIAYVDDAANMSAVWGDEVTAGSGTTECLVWYVGSGWFIFAG